MEGTWTPAFAASTPHCGQPLRQPKRGSDVDPGFRRGDGVGPHPTRHSGGSRNPRTPTLRDSASTPHCGQPLRQPKRGSDVDPGFRRGDGVGPHPSPTPRHSGESRKPRTPTLRDSASTPLFGQPLRQPKRGRDVDPGFRRGDGVGPSGRRSRAIGASFVSNGGRKQPPQPVISPTLHSPLTWRRPAIRARSGGRRVGRQCL